jgi:FkbM family methyltransferase
MTAQGETPGTESRGAEIAAGFISYAQNFEDVLLMRALQGVEQGCYVDVGAQDPRIDSVSLAFYERGWRGVHVEPVESYAEALRLARPGDLVIAAAVGSAQGSAVFNHIEGTGLSTLRDDIAARHGEAGFPVAQTRVAMVSLDEVLERAPKDDIHWLKIDVEGAEDDVLRSWNHARRRPWVVVIESTVPLKGELVHMAWEPRLLAMGYRFAHFDGLNRFYVSDAHLDLLDRLATGPNVFDDFALSGEASAPFTRLVNARAMRAETERDAVVAALAEQAAVAAARQRDDEAREVRLQSEMLELRHRQVALQRARQVAEAETANLRAIAHAHRLAYDAKAEELTAVYASTSWKISRPIRVLKRSLSAGPLRALKATVRPALLRFMRAVLARPALKRACMLPLMLCPPLLRRLQRIAINGNLGGAQAAGAIGMSAPVSEGALSPKASRILGELMNAMKDTQP